MLNYHQIKKKIIELHSQIEFPNIPYFNSTALLFSDKWQIVKMLWKKQIKIGKIGIYKNRDVILNNKFKWTASNIYK